jgi:lipopolysaccharide export system permease protein
MTMREVGRAARRLTRMAFARAREVGTPAPLLDRYVGMGVARGYLVVMLVLVIVFSLLTFVEDLDDVGKGRYRLPDSVAFVALTTPQRVVDLLPMVALLGSVAALGALAAGSELVAMQAAGLAPLRIAWAVLRPGLVAVVASLLIAEFVAPPLEKLAHWRRGSALSAAVAQRFGDTLWSRDGPRFLHVRHVPDAGRLLDVRLFEFDEEGRLTAYTRARTADVREAGGWVLRDVEQKVLGPDGLTTQHLPRLPVEPALTAAEIDRLVLPPSTLALSELRAYVDYLRTSGQDAARYELALWRKLTTPVATCAMILMAVPFVLGSLRSASAGQRMVLSSVVAMVFYLGSQILERAGLLFHVAAPVTTLVPSGAAFALALWLFRRVG